MFLRLKLLALLAWAPRSPAPTRQWRLTPRCVGHASGFRVFVTRVCGNLCTDAESLLLHASALRMDGQWAKRDARGVWHPDQIPFRRPRRDILLFPAICSFPNLCLTCNTPFTAHPLFPPRSPCLFFALAQTALHVGLIPLIVVLGMTTTEPRPSLAQVLSPM